MSRKREALRRIRAHVLLVGISSDWLFPPEDVRDLAQRIRAAGHACDYAELKSSHGHDGFLADMDQLAPFITAALWRPAANPVSITRAAGGARRQLTNTETQRYRAKRCRLPIAIAIAKESN